MANFSIAILLVAGSVQGVDFEKWRFLRSEMTSVEEYLGVRDEKKRAKWIIGTGSVSLERIKGGRNEFFPTQIFRDLYRIVNEIQSQVYVIQYSWIFRRKRRMYVLDNL